MSCLRMEKIPEDAMLSAGVFTNIAATLKAPAVVSDIGSVCVAVYPGEEVVTAPSISVPVCPLVVEPCAALVG